MTEIKLKDMTEEQIADLEAQLAELRTENARKPLVWKPQRTASGQKDLRRVME